MITSKELLEKSDKLFFKTVRALLKDESVFPLAIAANKRVSATGFSELKAAIVPLYQHSKQAKGKGYTIEWKEKRVDGTKQKLPAKIYFESLEDYLFYTKRAADYRSIQNAFAALSAAFPKLTEWAKDSINFLLIHEEILPDLIKVCRYFEQNKPPHLLYLRELPITVHSKFIEDNTAPLKKLLDEVLPPDWINKKETDFLDRYGVKKPNVYAQIRILDEELKGTVGFNELALTLEDSASLTWKPAKVFIIENKACFLSFPHVKNAVAIFGEGFKSRVSKHLPWLANTSIYCWFDLDAAGFEMLNTIRGYYPSTRSLMMDEATYEQFKQFEVIRAYRKLQLDKLTADELSLYEFLQTNNKRLEHERITQQYVQEQLSRL
ncbi:MAG: Wadjet anti-phage system protein JetD domain-containing protein [Chitinophagaceae bacterium]